MPADINIGDNYELDENSNGNLVIRDSTGNGVLEHTDGGGWSINTTADINDLTDSTSGNTVYDSSTETFGDGTQSADLDSVNTGGETLELIEEKTTESGPLKFDNLSGSANYAVRINEWNEPSDLDLTFNGNTSAESHVYWDVINGRQTSDRIKLLDVNNFTRVTGWIRFEEGKFGGVGMTNGLRIGRANNVNSFAIKGGAAGTNQLSSVEFRTPGTFSSDIDFQLWQVIG